MGVNHFLLIAKSDEEERSQNCLQKSTLPAMHQVHRSSTHIRSQEEQRIPEIFPLYSNSLFFFPYSFFLLPRCTPRRLLPFTQPSSLAYTMLYTMSLAHSHLIHSCPRSALCHYLNLLCYYLDCFIFCIECFFILLLFWFLYTI